MLTFILKFIIFTTPLYLIRFELFGIPTSVLEVSIYALFLVWLVKYPKGWAKTLDWKIWLPVGLIFFSVTLSTLFSNNFIASAGIWKAYFLDPLLFLVIFVTTFQKLETSNYKLEIQSLLKYFLSSGYVVAIISLIYLMTNNLTYDGRLSAFYLSPNHLAMFLAPVLLVNIYFLATDFLPTDLYGLRRIYMGKRIIKLLLLVGLLLVSFVIFFTYSFGAWIGLAGAMIVWALARSGIIFKYKMFLTRKFLIGSLILLIVLCSMFYVLWLSSIADYFDVTGRSSFHSRIMIWESSVKMLENHWILGIGPGMFQDYYLNYQKYFPPYLEWAVPQPHNIFLAFWLQTGIIGLIGFLWLLVDIFRKLQKSDLNNLYFLVVSFFAYFIIHGLVDTIYWKNDLALIFWFFVGITLIVTRTDTNDFTNNEKDEYQLES